MKLWNFLKSRMELYSSAIAFSHEKITYGDLIAIAETEPNGFGTLRLIECSCRARAAIDILKCIACGDVAVPVDKGYGQAYIEHIQSLMKNDTTRYRDIAFIVFTSGTTGTPKGAILSDEAIIANLKGIENYCDIEAGKRIMIIRPIVHIAVLVGELLFGLCRGMEISFYEENFFPQRLVESLKNERTQVIGCTPTILYRLHDYLEKTALTDVIISGERLSPVMITLLERYREQINFYNVYGLTENSPRVAALRPAEFFLHSGSVGKAIANTKLKLYDGELLVHSKSVMNGYYKRPDFTKKKLHGGWLHTGDVAQIDEEGYVYILGRKDGMIIRAGLNIFPEDIEAEAEQIDGVDDCIVYGEDDIRYGQKVCLDYVGKARVQEVRKRLIEILPCNMVPNQIQKVEKIPQTVSGKKKRNK